MVSLGLASDFIDAHGRVDFRLTTKRVPVLSIALSNQRNYAYAEFARHISHLVWFLLVLIAVTCARIRSILLRLVHIDALSVPAITLMWLLTNVHERAYLLQSVRLGLSHDLEVFSGLLVGLNLLFFKGVLVWILCAIILYVLNLNDNTGRTFSAGIKIERGGSLVVLNTHLWPFLRVTCFRWEWIFHGRAWSLLGIIIVELYVVQFWIRWGSRARMFEAFVHCAVISVRKYLFLWLNPNRLSL